MTRPGKWYSVGLADGLAGIFDPPWHPGHRDHISYREGYQDAQQQLDRADADRADQLDRLDEELRK